MYRDHFSIIQLFNSSPILLQLFYYNQTHFLAMSDVGIFEPGRLRLISTEGLIPQITNIESPYTDFTLKTIMATEDRIICVHRSYFLFYVNQLILSAEGLVTSAGQLFLEHSSLWYALLGKY